MDTNWIIAGSIVAAIALALVAVGIWFIYKRSVRPEAPLAALSPAELQRLEQEDSSNNTTATVLIVLGILIGGPAGFFIIGQGLSKR